MLSYNKVISIHILIHTTLLSWVEFFQRFNTRKGGGWNEKIRRSWVEKKNQKLTSGEGRLLATLRVSLKALFWAPESGRLNWYIGLSNSLDTSLLEV